jgi:hypothetical protein
VLTATTHLTRVQDLAAYNDEYFPSNKPARTTVTVAALNAPELSELEGAACLTVLSISTRNGFDTTSKPRSPARCRTSASTSPVMRTIGIVEDRRRMVPPARAEHSSEWREWSLESTGRGDPHMLQGRRLQGSERR